MDGEHATKQPSEYDELDKQPIPGENKSLDDLTPNTSPEHKNLHKRLIATARSLKKQKGKLKNSGGRTQNEKDQSTQYHR